MGAWKSTVPSGRSASVRWMWPTPSTISKASLYSRYCSGGLRTSMKLVSRWQSGIKRCPYFTARLESLTRIRIAAACFARIAKPRTALTVALLLKSPARQRCRYISVLSRIRRRVPCEWDHFVARVVSETSPPGLSNSCSLRIAQLWHAADSTSLEVFINLAAQYLGLDVFPLTRKGTCSAVFGLRCILGKELRHLTRNSFDAYYYWR